MEDIWRGGLSRVEKIDLQKMDEQLDRLWIMQKRKEREKQMKLREWEIDADKLTVNVPLASGTYASVYKGVYDGQDVAVKVLELGEESKRSRVEAAFMKEVSVWHKLDHPNIAKLIGAKMDSTNCCIVSEYLCGGSVKSYLQQNRERKLPFKTVIQLGLDLARGLSYLHSKKIIHRDVKTENLLLDKNFRLKIIDFDVSRDESLNLDEMTGSTGTVGYMAPEVIECKPYNRKCDVYSFGICLWEICSCNSSSRNLSLSRLSRLITSPAVRRAMKPDIPGDCPKALANVMRKCWNADPNSRPEMEEVVAMLEAIKDTSTSTCFCFFRRA
ncbi:hypothetical protein SLA2020_109160 [Shorea laevis]